MGALSYERSYRQIRVITSVQLLRRCWLFVGVLMPSDVLTALVRRVPAQKPGQSSTYMQFTYTCISSHVIAACAEAPIPGCVYASGTAGFLPKAHSGVKALVGNAHACRAPVATKLGREGVRGSGDTPHVTTATGHPPRLLHSHTQAPCTAASRLDCLQHLDRAPRPRALCTHHGQPRAAHERLDILRASPAPQQAGGWRQHQPETGLKGRCVVPLLHRHD